MKEAKRLAFARGDLAKLGPGSIDDGPTVLLVSPEPSEVLKSVTMSQLLEQKVQNKFLQLFVQLDINTALARRRQETFEKSAKELYELLQRLRANATACEFSTFSGGAAKDELDLQLQAEALSAIQWRVNSNLTEATCNAVLPDIDKHQSQAESYLLLMIAGAVSILFLVLVTCVCACKHCRKRRAQVEAGLLGTGQEVSMSELPAVI